MNKADLLARIDNVLARGYATIDSAGQPKNPAPYAGYNHDHTWVAQDLAAGFRTAGTALLNAVYGKDAQPFKDFDVYTNDKRTVSHYKQAYALLQAVRDEVDNNWFYNTRALIAADVFSDFMEMAEYLLSEGYKDAAAVLIGGTLEGHLRGLAPNYNVATHALNNKTGKNEPRKAESLNQDLYKNQAYVLGDQKNVTAWLDLRNNAAHAHYNHYTQDQVVLMLKGVADFVKRVPA